MATGRRIVIEFLGNNSSLDRAMNTSTSRSAKFGDALKKAGKVAALGLAAGALVAGKALFDMTKAAIEDEASQKRLATALKNNAKATDEQVASVEDWITAQGLAKGVADDELRPALEKLVGATKDVGEAQKLAKLAMDISAGSGKSLEAVSTALAKAQNGQVSSLSRLGIKTKDTVKDQTALKQAALATDEAQRKYTEAVDEHGASSVEARTASQKMQIAQDKLADAQKKTKSTTIDFTEAQKRLSKQFGGAAADQAETLQGKIGRLKLIMAETGETIGAKLIPVVTKMADWFLKKGLPAIQEFGGYLQRTLPPIFERIRAVISKVMGGMSGDVGGSLGDVKSIIRDAVSIIQSLWKRFGGFITDYVVATFKNVKQVIGGALQVIRGIFKTVSSLLKGDWKGAWDGIKMIVKGAWQVIQGLVKQALNYMKLLMRVGWSAIKGIVGAAWDGIKELAARGLDKVVDTVKSIPGKIKALAGMYRDVGKFLIGALIDGLSKAGSFVSDIAGNVWNAVKGMINSAIDKINSSLEFTIDIPGPKNVDINPPNIPHLAKGGIVRRPTLALIGEDGPEAVVPLGRKNAPRGGMPALGGGNVYITVQSFDPRAAGQAVVKALREVEKSTGRKLLVANP